MPEKRSRTIAIGDVHGCSAALDSLLDAIDPQPNDLIVLLGDYVDRGPHSRAVIDRLIALADQCRMIPLLGNHEIMMLAAIEGHDVDFWLSCGGFETLVDYNCVLSDVPQEHIEFMGHCRRYFETPTHIFLHANYQADLPLDAQPDHLVFWEHLTFSAPEPHFSGKTVVVGHTPQYDGEVLDLGHLVCIDTLCFGGGWLTALDLDTGDVWQADADGKMRVVE